MVKHTQTIRQQKPTNCLSVFDHFVGLALKWLKHRESDQFMILIILLCFPLNLVIHGSNVKIYQ